ncbi:MAG: CehA/McbA family metallohydrolase [Clostridia bacterium]|nr:CehA/McbA family metallohydrolase [Clostridia bacterium]
MNKYYPFELHCHTFHSDGEMSPKTLVNASKKRGYTGIAVTDHNTVSAVDETVALGKECGLKVIRGIEWTTFFGHITALGNNTAVDWREIDMQNIDAIIEKASKAGAVLTVAHPKRHGSPMCKGCYMELPITKYQYISGFEVWSQKTPNREGYNLRAIELYDSLLCKGNRLAAVYGYDWHREKADYSYAYTFIGDKDEPERAIKSGDTFVSAGLGLDVKVDGQSLPFGSELEAGKHVFEITVVNFFEDFCSRYGVIPKGVALKGSSCAERVAALGEKLTVNCSEGYLRIEIFGDMEGASNLTLALASPYYVIDRR